MEAMENNCDGECVRWAGQQLLNTKAGRRVLIVLSDGSPCCASSSNGRRISADLKRAVKQLNDREPIMNDAASLALLLYENNKQTIRAAIEQGEHGRFLRNIGFGSDVVRATDVDSIPVLPVLREGRLVSFDAGAVADQ